jgi:hypothetical protein
LKRSSALKRASLEQVWEWVRASTLCPFASAARIWVGPNWATEVSWCENLEAIAIDLHRFCDAFRREEYAGFVIEILIDEARAQDLMYLASCFCAVLRDLVQREGKSIDREWRDIESPGWQFTFHETRIFMNLFAPCYP